MKYGLLSSVCGAALIVVAGPAAADNTFSGNINLNYGAGTTSSSNFVLQDVLDDPQYYTGSAKGYWPLSQEVNLQVDLFAERTDNLVRDWGTNEHSTTYGGAVHLLHPFENRARLGIAGSIWNNDIYVDDGNGQTDKTYGLALVEGQFFGTDWTLTGQGGFFGSIGCSDWCGGSLDSGSFIRGKIRYFLHDNTSLSVETVQMWGTLDSDDASIFDGKSAKYSKWKLEAEHRFEGSEFSGLLGLSHETSETEVTVPETADTDTVWLGIKFYYNETSLRENDKTGAELDTPTFGDLPETDAVLAEFYGIG
ncbi:MAG: hypothetical protein ABL973_20915 [Micropepsaceae bacterium]